ncbi:hypothetical protein [Brevundimonas sp.]|uniref:hypothetical protein n=1 Tax=Brevundimonas sp. TaxID=1871086 RepID=UPI003D13DFB2
MIRNAKIALGVVICGAVALLAAMIATTDARAEVVSRSADGFVLRFESVMETTPEDMVETVSDLPEWWDGAHTYTGDNANLSLAFEPGGCWCETLADGTGFRHATVVSSADDTVVFNAPLGPLNGKATRADLTFHIGGPGPGWLVSVDFVVEGPDLGAMADGVNGVMEQAFGRYVHHLHYGETDSSSEAPRAER